MERKMYITSSDEMCNDLFDEIGSCTIFSDEDGKLITTIHLNDGYWRSEYFNPIMKYYGITVVDADNEMLSKIEADLKQRFNVK